MASKGMVVEGERGSGGMFLSPEVQQRGVKEEKSVKANLMWKNEVFLERKPLVPKRSNSRASYWPLVGLVPQQACRIERNMSPTGALTPEV